MEAGAIQVQHTLLPWRTTGFGHAQFSEPCEHVAALGDLACAQCLQTKPGRFIAEMWRMALSELELCVVSISGSSVYHSSPHPGIDTIILPLRWTGALRWNGEVIQRPVLLRCADYYTRAATDIEAVGIGFARAPVEEAAAALAGVEPARLTIPEGPLPGDDGHAAALMGTLRTLARLATSRRARFMSKSARHTARDLLLGQIAELYAHSFGHPSRNQRRQKQLRCVRLAEKCFEAAPNNRVSLSELCAAAGVSARSLQYAFREIYGMTPTQYFKARRLARARTLLRKAQPERGAVKRAALEVGATELGRFSIEYRGLFGESPSVTLGKRAS